MAQQLEFKEKQVREILSLSSTFESCTHKKRSSRRLVFIDWYLILQVNENEGVEAIRKRYHQLALQLHPDKNKHPKSDVAFKLVFEAYECLSDTSKRKAFNTERLNRFCMDCYNKSNSNSKPSETLNLSAKRNYRALREIQNRMREEYEIVQNCLRGNRFKYGKGCESPVFNPSEQARVSPRYPYYRNLGLGLGFARDRRGEWCESPVYEVRPENQNRKRNFGFWF